MKKIKPKTARSRRVNTSTPCWKFFTVPGLDENSSKCSKCGVNIVCVDKNNKLTTTSSGAFDVPPPPPVPYEQRLKEAHEAAEQLIIGMLYKWENAEFNVPDGQ